MPMLRHSRGVMVLCAWLWAGAAVALESTMVSPPAASLPPGAGVSSNAPLANPAPVAAAVDAPPTAASDTPAAAPVETVDGGPAPLSASAVAGIPLEDGGELVLGPEEKVSSDDHAAATQRFAHMRHGGKLAASSDLDREVPNILRREQAGDVVGAMNAARAALARMPDHKGLRQITARLQVANGDYSSALQTLAPLLDIDRDNWLPFYWAGVAELMQLNLDNARAYLARACQLDADRAEPWIARAVVEQESGNFAGSLQLFAVARQRSPARAEIRDGIAYSEAMLRQPGPGAPVPTASLAGEVVVTQPTPATPSVTTTSPRVAPGSSPAFASDNERRQRGVSSNFVP